MIECQAVNEPSTSKPNIFFIADKVNHGEVKIAYMPTQQMWIDINTKPKQGRHTVSIAAVSYGRRNTYHAPMLNETISPNAQTPSSKSRARPQERVGNAGHPGSGDMSGMTYDVHVVNWHIVPKDAIVRVAGRWTPLR